MRTLNPSSGFVRNTSILALAALSFACGGTKAAPPKADAQAPILPANAEPVPTAEEAAKAAAAKISEENADAELERLKKELGDG